MVQKVVECHAVEISEKNICDVHCLIVSRRQASDKSSMHMVAVLYLEAFEDLPISVPLRYCRDWRLSSLNIVIPEHIGRPRVTI